MGIIKVLKRKDGASLVVGVALGMVISSYLYMMTFQLAEKLSRLGENVKPGEEFGGMGWRMNYLSPTIALILSILALEILIWVYIGLHGLVAKKKK